jgi:hypothetical protein
VIEQLERVDVRGGLRRLQHRRVGVSPWRRNVEMASRGEQRESLFMRIKSRKGRADLPTAIGSRSPNVMRINFCGFGGPDKPGDGQGETRNPKHASKRARHAATRTGHVAIEQKLVRRSTGTRYGNVKTVTVSAAQKKRVSPRPRIHTLRRPDEHPLTTAAKIPTSPLSPTHRP